MTFLFWCRRRDETPGWLRFRRWLGLDPPDLAPRWKAFIESKPVIKPAKVPAVKPLKAKKRESEFLRLLKRRA